MATVTLDEIPLARIGLGTNRLTSTPENVAFVGRRSPPASA
jgi:hypothetical protein